LISHAEHGLSVVRGPSEARPAESLSKVHIRATIAKNSVCVAISNYIASILFPLQWCIKAGSILFKFFFPFYAYQIY
jgi:hypothetical protein